MIFKKTELGLLPENWQVDKLKNHLTIKGRIGWKGLKKSEYTEKGFAIINGEQIDNGKIVWKNVGRITEARYLESPEIMLKENDILMTKDGTIGKLAFLKTLPEPATVASGVFVIRNNSSVLNQNFLYQYFRSHFFKYLVSSRLEGSVVPHLYQRDITELNIPLPSPNEQKIIASILSSLDDKIELNLKMNQTLESIAQEIFKQWFIDFQFPDATGEMENEIPKDWKKGNLAEGFNITMGQSPPGESYNESGEGIIFFQGRTDFGFRFPSTRIYTTNPKRFAEKFETLVSVRAPVGDLNMAIEKCCIGRGVGSIIHKNGFTSFTYYFLKSIQDKIKRFDLDGTVFGSITKKNFESIEVIFPKEEIIKEFENLVKPFDNKIFLNTLQIINLTKTRDSLLPRLITGQISAN